MNMPRMIAATGVAALLSAPASANFVGLSIENATGLFTGGNHFGANQANVEAAWDIFTQSGANPHTVYRLYADFDDSNDFLLDIGTIPGPGPGNQALDILVTHPNPTAPVVYNDADNGRFAPTETALADPATARRAFDTFATIGMDVDNGTNQTMWGTDQGNIYSFFGNDPVDAGLHSSDVDSWGVNPGDPQSYAVPGGPAGYRVLIAQFTVVDGTQLSGTLSGTWGTDTFLAGDPELFGFTASFSTLPAPGALAMLGMAGFVGARRRRA